MSSLNTESSTEDGVVALTEHQLIEGALIDAVRDALDGYCLPNATFLAERLVAASPTDANAHLLAQCYYYAAKPVAVYDLLGSRLTSSPVRYLFAKACYDLGKLAEAERALRARGVDAESNEFVGAYGARKRPTVGEDDALACGGANGEYLLGEICRDTGRNAAATAHFTRALSADPLMWSAYEALCALGADAEARACMSASREDSIFSMYPSVFGNGAVVVPKAKEVFAPRMGGLPPLSPTRGRRSLDRSNVESAVSTPRAVGSVGYDVMNTVPPSTGASDRTHARDAWDATDMRTPAVGAGAGFGEAGDSISAFVTPSPSSAVAAPPPPQKGAPAPRAPPTTGIGAGRGTMGTAAQPSARETTGARRSVRGLFGERRKFMDEGKLRKVSGRLFSDDPTSSAVRRSSRINASRAPNAAATPEGDAHGDDDASYLSQVPEDGEVSYDAYHMDEHHQQGAWRWQPAFAGRTAEGTFAVFNMLQPLAEGLRQLAMYRCEEAISSFNKLAPEQYNTGYVLCTVAKAYAEMVDYSNAARKFEQARAVAPYRVEGLDVYSTVLWHLKQDVKLAHLAQTVEDIDRWAPETWCVLGNCFSLQKEHETALKFFQRALHINPKYTYAHTLCGHEYFANEDFEKSMNCYRAALRLDSRHYNAWYGLGTVYYRQEKYVMSEYHFRYALNINARSSVLYCYLGMAKHALDEHDAAMELLQRAIVLDGRNPLARYEMAAVLMSIENYEQALAQLEQLQEIAPKEASVFFLMGRIYKKLGMQDKAMINFSVALDLRPSTADTNAIKNAVEKLDAADDSEEEDI